MSLTLTPYRQLNLSGSILDSDINASAAIGYPKLNLTASILNADLAGGIADEKIASSATWNAKQNALTTSDNTQYIAGDLSLITFPTNVSAFINDAGYISNNAAITFTASGDVSGSSSGLTSLNPTLVIGANKVTNSMLSGGITFSNLVGTDITKVGTLITGTWNAATIATIKGGTNITAYTTGDILYGSASNVLSKLSIGSTGSILKVISGIPGWSADISLLTDGSRPLTAAWNMGAFTATTAQTASAANTVLDGFILSNTTPATLGNQMYSPAIHFIGQGWKTNTTAASQQLDARIYGVPMQSATNPLPRIYFDAATNGGAYTLMGYWSTDNSGQLNINTGGATINATGNKMNLDAPSGTGIMFGGTTGTWGAISANTSYFTYITNTCYFGGIIGSAATARIQIKQGGFAAGSAPLKLTGTFAIATTAASGTGTTVTLTFSAQTSAPYVVGSSITVAGVTPTGYNGTYTVTSCTATTVQYAGSTTGSQTVPGTITSGQILSTPEDGAFEYDGTHLYFTIGSTRHTII